MGQQRPPVHPDGRHLISGGSDMTIRWWDVKTGKQTHLARASDQVTSIDLSPDGTLLASNGGDQMLFWDAASGKPLPGPKIGDHYLGRGSVRPGETVARYDRLPRAERLPLGPG